MASETYRQRVYQRYGLTCPPRRATLRDFSRPTYGGKVAKIAAALGTPLMPWQRYVADVALEIDPATGTFAYRKVGIRVPRQSGKTSLILPLAVWRAMAWQRQLIVYAAQSGTAAREKWEDDQVEALLASPLKNRFRVRRANGREALIWKATRSLHKITTNTEKAGHGKTMHLGLGDEYFAQVDYRLEAAWGPAMITVASAQLWWLSTAGTSRSLPLNEETAAGRALVESGERSRTAYFEWEAEPGADYTSPVTWRTCMPALCPTPGPCTCSRAWKHTVTEDTIAAELESAMKSPAKLAEFLRAYMNWTRDDDEVAPDPFLPSVEAWNLLADDRAAGGPVVACSIDITPRRDYAAIAAVGGGPDELRRGLILEHHPGTDWIMEKVVAINRDLKPVAWVVDERSPAATLITPMEKAGIKRMKQEPHHGGLWVLTTAELGAACGAWADGVTQATLVHPGQDVVKQSLAVARSRPLGDGMWAFGRKINADVDICSLPAWAQALAGYEKYKHLAGDYDVAESVY